MPNQRPDPECRNSALPSAFLLKRGVIGDPKPQKSRGACINPASGTVLLLMVARPALEKHDEIHKAENSWYGYSARCFRNPNVCAGTKETTPTLQIRRPRYAGRTAQLWFGQWRWLRPSQQLWRRSGRSFLLDIPFTELIDPVLLSKNAVGQTTFGGVLADEWIVPLMQWFQA